DLLALSIADERVRDVPERQLDGALVGEEGFLGAGLGEVDAAPDPAAFEQRLERARADGPERRRAREERRQGGALLAARRGKRDLGKVVRLGPPDLGVGGDQLLLGLSDVRAALEQGRWESRRNVDRVGLVDELAAARDGSRILAHEHADQVLLLLDAPFEIRN